MQTQIDNIPHIKQKKVLSSLVDPQSSFSVIKGFEPKKVFSPTSVESMSNIKFDTIIKPNKDTNTYEVLTDPNEDESSREIADKEEGDEGKDSDGLFQFKVKQFDERPDSPKFYFLFDEKKEFTRTRVV